MNIYNQPITKSFFLGLLLSAFAPLATLAEGLYSDLMDKAVQELMVEYGIDESYAEKPGKIPYRSNLQDQEDEDVVRSRAFCCKKQQGCKQGYSADRLALLDAATQQVVTSGQAIGAFTTSTIKSPCGGFKDHTFYAGVQNVISQKPCTGNTIIRLASMSKFLGTVGFLKLIDKGVITGFEQLSTYIPAFANTKVMTNFTPTASVTLAVNPITTAITSDVISINQPAHGRSTGDVIGLQAATSVGGIPANQINKVYPITVTGVNDYTITIASSLTNALFATNTSSTLRIHEFAHGRTTGQQINIVGAPAVQGIPAVEINGTHAINVVDANNYTIITITSSTGTSPITGDGGTITVQSIATSSTTGGGTPLVESLGVVATGVKQTVKAGIYYYYTLQALNNPILLYHVLTHELGYSYWLGSLNLSFGFAFNPTLRNTQASIYNELQIPMGFPDPSLPLSSGTISQWAPALAQVPLLFQPGTKWSYGPSLSILGALIPLIDPLHRDLETYLQQEVLQPIGMNSSGFFIQNNDTDRAGKLARIMTLYFANTTSPVTAVPTLAYFEEYFYGLAQPKTLAFIDGGLYSTPNDYLKFIKMMLNNGFSESGESILSPAMLCYLSENHTLDNSIYNILDFTPSLLTPGKFAKWGLGVAIGTGATMLIPEVGCSTRSIYWGGFFRTLYAIDFGNNFGVSGGTNVLGSESSNYRDRMIVLNYSALNCVNPNNENSSANNPSSSSNPT